MADSNAKVRLVGRLSQRLISHRKRVPANIYADSELDREATIRSFRIVQTEGSREVSRTRLVG